MAYRATAWAYDLQLSNVSQKFLLVALADMADEEFSCYPGQEKLAAMTATSVSTVRRAVQALEQLGLIRREERRIAGGYKTSDRYYLNVGAQPVTGQSDRQDSPVNVTAENDSHRSMKQFSPVNDDILTGQPDRYIEVEHPVEPSGESSGGARKRGTRIPNPFVVTAEMRKWAAQRCPHVDVDASTELFVNYWRAKAGRDATKLDWELTWHNWLIRDQSDAAERKPAPWTAPAGRETMSPAAPEACADGRHRWMPDGTCMHCTSRRPS